MRFLIEFKVFDDEKNVVGSLQASDRHYRTGEALGWLFAPEPGFQFSREELIEIAEKIGCLEEECSQR